MMGNGGQEGRSDARMLALMLEEAACASSLEGACGSVAERLKDATGADLVVVIAGERVLAAAGAPARSGGLDTAVELSRKGSPSEVEIDGVGAVTPVAGEAPPRCEAEVHAFVRSGGSLSDQTARLFRPAGAVIDLIFRMYRAVGEERRGRHEAEVVRESLIERVPTIVYIAEMGEAGAWRFISPRIEELLGFTAAEWTADPSLWADRIHPEDREAVLAAETSNDGRPGRSSRLEYRLIAKDGRVVWVLDDARLELDPEGIAVWHGVIQDITERKEAERALERLAARQAQLAELGEQAVSGVDLGTLMESATAAVRGDAVTAACVWERVQHGGGLRMKFGLKRSDEPTAPPLTATAESHAGAATRLDQPVIVEDWEREDRFEMPAALRESGVRSSLATVIDASAEPYGVFDMHSDRPGAFGASDVHLAQSVANVLASAIQRSRADQELRHRVLHDDLTGLPNRQLFSELLERALQRARRNGSPIAVLFLDLDHFKVVNDSLGHHVGDELLRIVAPRLVGRLRPADVVARFGGDEFGMLVEDLTDESEAVAVAERVGHALSRPISIGGIEHFVTASIGIAVADPAGGDLATADSLVRDADAAMYKAKDLGRARHQLFGEEMRASALVRMETQHRLRHAVAGNELMLEYQPIVSLSSGSLIGVEALVRWDHPERGILLPHDFVPVAEESGLIGEIGGWVLETAIEQALRWHEERPDDRPITIAVNISPRQVAQPGFAEQVGQIVDRTGIEPGRIYLEITENALVEESSTVSETLDALSEMGVSLVLDDFGTGYSSLAYLNRFPMNALKIDRTFVEKLQGGLATEHEGVAIVEAILAMAEALSLEVIAEGVSEAEHAARLRRMGCHFAQGYAFSRPMGPEQMTELIRDPTPLRELISSFA